MYECFTETDVQEHLRQSANNLQHGDRIEVLLCEAGVIVPMVKHVSKTRTATFDVWIRSGSIERDQLAKLRDSLVSESYNVNVYHTTKRKLLKRLVVRLPLDGTISVTGLKILRTLNTTLGYDWPTAIIVSYGMLQPSGVPGKLSFRNPARARGYEIGFGVGKFVRKLLG
jgi:hypothetical protein